jgi:hypothetical protein
MDYKTQMRVALMKGIAHRTKGQGISYVGERVPQMNLDNEQMSGTISHRVIRDLVEPLSQGINDLNIKKKVRGQGITRKKIYDDEGTTRKTKGSGFKPLKFNF